MQNIRQNNEFQQLTLEQLMQEQETQTQNVVAIKNTLEDNSTTLTDTKNTVDNIYEEVKKLNKTDEESVKTQKGEFKTSLETMIFNIVSDYGVKPNDKKPQAKNIFNKLWTSVCNEKDFKYVMDLETSAMFEDLINQEMAKLREYRPELFNDFYEKHESEIVREIYSDLCSALESIVKKDDIIQELKIELKRINQKLDEIQKEKNSAIREMRNNYIEIANPYLEKYFGK